MPKVKTIIYPNTVEKIYGYTENNDMQMTELKNVVLSKNLKEIGDEAFSGCRGLTNITIPEGVTSIGSGAFKYCSELTNITIPEKVTSIGNSAFYCCYNLTTVKYEGTKEQWNSISIGTDNDELNEATIECIDGVIENK